jgi:hypothetical protein
MKTPRIWLPLLAVAVTAFGCASALPIYRLAGAPAAEAPDHASYAIRATGAPRPTGAVQVQLVGGERIPVGIGLPPVYLHVVLVAKNETDELRWALDPNEQRLLCGDAVIAPAFAKASGKSPVLFLRKGAWGTLDLYYRMPADQATQVTVEWHVRRGAEVLAIANTTFHRLLPPLLAAGQPARPYESTWPHESIPSDSYDSRYQPTADAYQSYTSPEGLQVQPPASNYYGNAASIDTAAPTSSPQDNGSSPPPPPSPPVQVEGAADKSGWRGGGQP